MHEIPFGKVLLASVLAVVYKHLRPYCPRFAGQNAVLSNCQVVLTILKERKTFQHYHHKERMKTN